MATGSSARTTLASEPLAPATVPCGAVWRRVDLHLHSPGVDTFRCPGGSDLRTDAGRRRLAEAYVQRLREATIEVGAITDYNGIRLEWFELLRDLAEKAGITLLPGAEVSFAYPKHGLHVLAVFKADTDLNSINAFLRGQHKDPTTRLIEDGGRHQQIDASEGPARVLTKLREKFGCLLIPPHPNQDNGLCKSMKAEDAARFLSELKPDAIEHLSANDLQRLKTNNACPLPWLDRVAQVEFSDPKCIEDIGNKILPDGSPRATYLKLSATSLEAIQLALYDPETRVRTGSIPASVHPRVRRMTVSGSGFLRSLVVEWNDDLNVLIGGRGVGKSAVVETLRYALAMTPYSDQSYREDLVRHALGSGGKVELVLERPVGETTRRYLVTRVWGEDPRVIDAGSGQPAAIRPAEVLGPNGGPTIFGQREIYAVSASEEYRLALLDELIGEEARARADAVRQSLERLRANARAIIDVQARLAKRDEYTQRLKAIEHEISVYEKHGAADKLKEATRLRSDGQHLRAATDALRGVQRDWGETQQSLLNPLETAHRGLLRGRSTQKAILEDAARVVDSLRTDLDRLLAEGASRLTQADQSLRELGVRWQAALRPLEEEINRIKREAQTEALDPDRLLRLTEERTAVVPLIEELERSEKRLAGFVQARETLLGEVRDQRHAEHELRRERADSIAALLEGRLELEVEFKGQKAEYKKRLSALLKGSGLSEEAINRLVTPEATDGIALAEAVQAGTGDVSKKFSITPAMAERLTNWLKAEASRLFVLQTLIPSDALRVKLKVDDRYRSLEHLSVGQRATAVLLLLFALEGRVLVLDQPEDDLDNRFVYDDIVQMLREMKGIKDPRARRQIIAASHNANIPVIGDAELVLALDVQQDHAEVIGRASIDDVPTRELVKTIMEGSWEAFQRRAEKYGGRRALA